MEVIVRFVLLVLCSFSVLVCYRCTDHSGAFRNTLNSIFFQLSDTTDSTGSRKSGKFGQGFVYVTKAVDGDTFWVNDGTQDIKVRFIGIDAPEARNAGKKKKGYFGKEASEYVKGLTEHKWVRLEYDVQKKDKFRRQLAYVYLEDGTFLNAHLVEHGYAVVDTYPPNVKYVDLFVKLQEHARMDGVGLWGKQQEHRLKMDL